MSLRFLFGPTTAEFAESQLAAPRRDGTCLAFGPGGVDLHVGRDATWDEIAAQFPDGWRPDLVALWLNYTDVPSGLWHAPVPLIGLATDWNLLWHAYRHLLPRCDAVLTDAPGVAALAHAGIGYARPAILYGATPASLVESPTAERDIDLLFVGNLHSAVQRERLPWVARLARLADRWKVVIRTGIPAAENRAMLARARIVFNRSVRSEANMRAFEAAAAGALLFQEASNRELPGLFADRRECVYYRDEDLETLLDYYLSHEEERRTIAEASRAKVASCTFPALLMRALEGLFADHATLLERAQHRVATLSDGAELPLAARVWMRLGAAGSGSDDQLRADLAGAAEGGGGEAAAAQHALGVLAPDSHTAAEAFRRARAAEPGQIVSGLGLALALAGSGRRDEAIEEARRILEGLERCASSVERGTGDGAPSDGDGPPPALRAGHESTDAAAPAVPAAWDPPTYPAAFDGLRVEWERAAWLHAGDPAGEVAAKQVLVRWRLHALLADLTDDLVRFEAAVAARPGLPVARAALGCALARAGRLDDALPHLRRAVADQPFDAAAARALYQVLSDLGMDEPRRALADERRLLMKAAPQMVRPEPWFAPPGAIGPAPAHSGGTAAPAIRVVTLDRSDFAARFGSPDTTRALCGYTPPADTAAVLTLLAHARPRRILEVGTALGHMTANLTEWSPDDAHVFSMGIVRGMATRGAPEQGYEAPDRAEIGRLADHFGKAHKAYFILADSLHYEFGRLAPLDFVFLDGGHDLEHALSDTRRAYEALRPGGWLVWHDFDSPVPWVRVREAIERLGLPEMICRVSGTEVAFLRKQAPLPAPPAPRPPGRPLRVVWEGDQQGLHSLALVNRALCRELLDRGHDLGLIAEATARVTPAEWLPADPRLWARLGRGPAGGPAQVHVGHHWPPRLDPPPQGRWVLMQPWEFGSLPRAWLPALRRVDEVWAYSRSVRDCYLDAGVEPERVRIIPLGVDPGVFQPGVEPRPLPPGPGFRFLFVGGTIHRKGFDLLLRAYERAFRPSDGVGLVVKDMGSQSFYRGQTAEAAVAELRARGYPIEYIDRALDERELAGLYAACDCLAHPYRGEGFALPVVEAMACGLPAIVTGAGPALDYASEATAFLVPARRAESRECRAGGLETIGRPWMWEPDLDALVELLRRAASDPASARAKGAAASAWIRGHFTWSRSADAVEARLLALGHPDNTSRSHGNRAGVGAGRAEESSTEDGGSANRLHGGPFFKGPAPSSPHLRVKPSRAARVSLTMIVRDEEENLPNCLESVRGVFDEIIVVDTGSVDRTRDIAREHGARVFDFVWVDDFAAARNAALARATGDYAFWLDADDVIEPRERERLIALLDGLRPIDPAGRGGLEGGLAAYVVKCACDPGEDGSGGQTVVDHIRLFPVHEMIRWTYRVHEQILPALRRANIPVRWTDLTVRHTGYIDRALRARKLVRDARILREELEERPDDPFVLFNLGSIAIERQEWREALALLHRSLAGSAPTDSITRKLYALIARAHQMLGEPREAMAACAAGLEADPDDAELLFREAVVRRQAGDGDGARRCWERILTLRRPEKFASVDQGIYGHLTRRNLAALAAERGDHDEAARQWRAVLEECPGDPEALTKLHQLAPAEVAR